MSVEGNGHVPHERVMELEIQVKAMATQLASIRSVCEAGWNRGDPCRLCNHIGAHAQTCYIRTSVGYDLLEEHEATLRENAELRAALAARLPVNGARILGGKKYLSLRARGYL